jgi:hypothetical protein
MHDLKKKKNSPIEFLAEERRRGIRIGIQKSPAGERASEHWASE